MHYKRRHSKDLPPKPWLKCQGKNCVTCAERTCKYSLSQRALCKNRRLFYFAISPVTLQFLPSLFAISPVTFCNFSRHFLQFLLSLCNFSRHFLQFLPSLCNFPVTLQFHPSSHNIRQLSYLDLARSTNKSKLKLEPCDYGCGKKMEARRK